MVYVAHIGRFVPAIAALLAIVCLQACLLVGYEREDRGGLLEADPSQQNRDGGSGEGNPDATVNGERDAEEELDGHPNAETPEGDASHADDDAGLDASEPTDAGEEIDCGDGGCKCPANGSACIGDLWYTCDAAGEVTSVVSCQEQATSSCSKGICAPGIGCTTTQAPNGSACDDGKFCTALDACNNGLCEGSASPCGADVCSDQVCDEAENACRVTESHPGKPCGSGLTCTATGSCESDSNCGGTCNPTCTGQQASCDLSCHDAASCNVGCANSQTCNTNCAQTNTCATSCSGALSNCNMNCTDATSCTGSCVNSDCSLDCDGTTKCHNSCTGFYSECNTSCQGSADCGTSCRNNAECSISNCQGGKCSADCDSDADCNVDCRDATQCKTSCTRDSSCIVDCRNSGSCQVACSLTSACALRCSPGDPNCKFTQCYGGATRCLNGWLVCHRSCLGL